MAKREPKVYFSIKNPGVYHTNRQCKEGDNIDPEHKRLITLKEANKRRLRPCRRCAQYS